MANERSGEISAGASWNPLDPRSRDNPFPALARWREKDPVNETEFGVWRLFRYDDVSRLLKDPNAGVRLADGTIPFGGALKSSRLGDFVLQQDPPAHTRLRKLVSHAFTPRAIDNWRTRVEMIVERQLDAFQLQGEIDVINDFALPITAGITCELLGVPIEDRDRFTAWAADATHGLAGPFLPPETMQRVQYASEALADYFEALIAVRKASLSDDLLSAMISAEEEGDRLTHAELLTQAIGVLIAGLETTVGVIGNGVAELIRHPGSLEKLRRNPQLISTAVEECLRVGCPILMTVRVLRRSTEFRGKVIPKDTPILAMIGSANRDPEIFGDPEVFDIERVDNPHLSFSAGSHHCLGAHLARMETQIAILRFVQRLRGLQLISNTVDWGPSLFRVPARLPVRFEP